MTDMNPYSNRKMIYVFCFMSKLIELSRFYYFLHYVIILTCVGYAYPHA